MNNKKYSTNLFTPLPLLLLLLTSYVGNAATLAITTEQGEMRFALDAKVARFKELANNGWFVGKEFYRVVPGHVIQAGINDDNHPSNQLLQVDGEFSTDRHFTKGSLGLARGDDANSGSTELFICLDTRAHLDGKYTWFGQLSNGQQTLDSIAAVPLTEKWLTDEATGKRYAFHQPKTTVRILAMSFID